ncbi:glucokinase [Asticcacaulis solisilvae]|uniref:glucokinase n=1 Tax=Asticcacaulis solisilvae TaxID=1217274 RepID=UPI003FD759AD
MSGKVLLGELSSGSYVQLALADAGQRPDVVQTYACASLDDFEGAIGDFLAEQGQPQLMAGAFSTSGWDMDGQIDLVHFGFTLKRSRLTQLLNVAGVKLVNNFVAEALALPILEAHERQHICGEEGPPGHVVAVIGPMTGLGGAFLSPNGHGGWVASHCEGGHADFAPRTELEIEILRVLMRKYGHVSREHAVSAKGLRELWSCLAAIEGDATETPSIEEILALACVSDARAAQAVRLQTEIYAGTASDFALMTGARGGVYLSGSFLEELGPLFDPAVFAARFYDKGRVSSYVRDIPVYRITVPDSEILGISTLFDAAGA